MHENKLNIETNKFYHDKLYNKQGDTDLIKIALPAYIKNFYPKDQITILQSWRYRLTEEVYAYKEGAKYYEKIHKKYNFIII